MKTFLLVLIFSALATAHVNSCVRFYDSILVPASYFKTNETNAQIHEDSLIVDAGMRAPDIKVWKTTGKGPYRPIDLLPEIDLKRRLLIGFDNGHTYFYFDGYRFDSNGHVGLRVSSMLLHKNSLPGDLFFILPNIPQSSIDALYSLIENFKVKSGLSCIRVTCKYLNQVGILDRNDFYKAQTLFFHLMEMKSADDSIQVIYSGTSGHNFVGDMNQRYLDTLKRFGVYLNTGLGISLMGATTATFFSK